MRALIVRLSVLATTLSCAVSAVAQDEASRRPNLIWIVVDDLGAHDLGCTGSKSYETPRIDAMAANGVLCTQGYAAAAICSPTRAALLTGRSPARLQLTDWIRARFQGGEPPADGKNPGGLRQAGKRPYLVATNPLWLEADEVTMAEHLRANGYATGFVGKWHLGFEGHFPTDQGFDENFGGCDFGQPPSYFDPYERKGQGGIPTLPPRSDGEYLTDRESDEAVGFIRSHKDERFFLEIAHYAVHTPIQGRKDLVERYREKGLEGPQDNAKYAAMVTSVDEAVGRVLDALEELDLTRSTLVVFTSDNGGLIGPTDNSPLRSGKGYAYEGGLRVPWIFYWPGKLSPTRATTPITSVDLMPTSCRALGLEAPERTLDGVDLFGALAGRVDIAARPLYWHFPHYRGRDVVPYSVIRDGRYKLIQRAVDGTDRPEFELFDLGADPAETKNLAEVEPERVRALAVRLGARLTDIGAVQVKRRSEDRTPRKEGR